MTPCKELGYTVGDRFKSTYNMEPYVYFGDTIVLLSDTASRFPIFFNLTRGGDKFSQPLSRVTKLQAIKRNKE